MEEAKIVHLYDLTHTAAAPYLKQFVYPWEALRGIGDFIQSLGPTLPADQYDHPSEGVWVAKSAKFSQQLPFSAQLSLDRIQKFAPVPSFAAVHLWEKAVSWAIPRN